MTAARFYDVVKMNCKLVRPQAVENWSLSVSRFLIQSISDMDEAHNYSPPATIRCYDTTIPFSLLVYVGISYFCGANEENSGSNSKIIEPICFFFFFFLHRRITDIVYHRYRQQR